MPRRTERLADLERYLLARPRAPGRLPQTAAILMQDDRDARQFDMPLRAGVEQPSFDHVVLLGRLEHQLRPLGQGALPFESVGLRAEIDLRHAFFDARFAALDRFARQ